MLRQQLSTGLSKGRVRIRWTLSQRRIDLVINIPKNYREDELTNDYLIRRRAVDFGIPLITNIQLAQRFVEALARKQARQSGNQELERVSSVN